MTNKAKNKDQMSKFDNQAGDYQAIIPKNQKSEH